MNQTRVSKNNLTIYFALFWLIFWLFNGLDKFLFHTDFEFITWYGKDRGWQFLTYITNMKLDAAYVATILKFAGIWEIIVAAIFAVFLLSWLFKRNQAERFYDIGLKASMLTFIGFCAFDIVAGDRAELLEHSLYIGIVAVSYLVSYVDKLISR